VLNSAAIARLAGRAVVLLAAAGLTGLGTASPASAWSYGLNRVQTAAEDASASTGYGPGWVGLSYKSNGPIVGYLFAQGFTFTDATAKPGFDHMDIRDTKDYTGGHPTITRWPWGLAHGGFDGCAYAYGTSKFAIQRATFSSDRCAGGPHVGSDGTWWHSETVFCTDQAADPLCSPAGVWSEGKPPGNPGLKPITSHGCTGYGNVGATAAYGGGASTVRLADPLGFVPAGQAMDLRYVLKNRQWVMAKWRAGNLAAGTEWAFFPRSCVS
jgi:hypothetical protein